MNKRDALFKGKSLKEIADFIKKEIPFNEMIENSGIYETNVIVRNIEKEYDITIGVSYEDSNRIGEPYELESGEKLEKWYYYNVFAGKEYVDLLGDCVGRIEDKLPTSVLIAIRKEISKLLGEDK